MIKKTIPPHTIPPGHRHHQVLAILLSALYFKSMAVKFELSFTQTSTMVVFTCTLLLAVALSFFELEVDTQSAPASLLRLVHLGTFSIWLGVQVWVTFFAGIVLMK